MDEGRPSLLFLFMVPMCSPDAPSLSQDEQSLSFSFFLFFFPTVLCCVATFCSMFPIPTSSPAVPHRSLDHNRPVSSVTWLHHMPLRSRTNVPWLAAVGVRLEIEKEQTSGKARPHYSCCTTHLATSSEQSTCCIKRTKDTKKKNVSKTWQSCPPIWSLACCLFSRWLKWLLSVRCFVSFCLKYNIRWWVLFIWLGALSTGYNWQFHSKEVYSSRKECSHSQEKKITSMTGSLFAQQPTKFLFCCAQYINSGIFAEK